MKKTFLHEKHIALGAKMAPFGGYEMPIQYKSIIFEHNATRQKATVFDTCHMGEFVFKGARALEDLELILSCPVASIKVGQCRYGYICNENGGVIDDQILYRIGEDEFFMVVNASTEQNDYEWISRHLTKETSAENVSDRTAKIDLQGPESVALCSRLVEEPIKGLKYYHFMHNRYRGEKILLSRTGYTGEVGFEFYSTSDLARQFWDECLAAGALPAGLGARDTLRLEMGYPLYGHELDEETCASWSGFSRAIGDKYFIGSDAIRNNGEPAMKLCGLLIEGRRTAHGGNRIFNSDGEDIGKVTSASFAPSLGQAIALGYLGKAWCSIGNPVSIATDRGPLAASVCGLPFYRQSTGRKNLTDYL